MMGAHTDRRRVVSDVRSVWMVGAREKTVLARRDVHSILMARVRTTPILPGGNRRDDPRLTVETAAAFAEISEWLVAEACRSGELHCFKKPNGEWSFTLPEYRRWLWEDREYRDVGRLAYLDRLIARLGPTDRHAA
jgi:hypothetical protein